MEKKFRELEVGSTFFFSVFPTNEHRFMKVLDKFAGDSGEANAVWLSKYTGLLCHFEDDDMVKIVKVEF